MQGSSQCGIAVEVRIVAIWWNYALSWLGLLQPLSVVGLSQHTLQAGMVGRNRMLTAATRPTW